MRVFLFRLRAVVLNILRLNAQTLKRPRLSIPAHRRPQVSGYLYHRAGMEPWTLAPPDTQGPLRLPPALLSALAGHASYSAFLQAAPPRLGLEAEVNRTLGARDGAARMLADFRAVQGRGRPTQVTRNARTVCEVPRLPLVGDLAFPTLMDQSLRVTLVRRDQVLNYCIGWGSAGARWEAMMASALAAGSAAVPGKRGASGSASASGGGAHRTLPASVRAAHATAHAVASPATSAASRTSNSTSTSTSTRNNSRAVAAAVRRRREAAARVASAEVAAEAGAADKAAKGADGAVRGAAGEAARRERWRVLSPRRRLFAEAELHAEAAKEAAASEEAAVRLLLARVARCLLARRGVAPGAAPGLPERFPCEPELHLPAGPCQDGSKS